MKTILPLFALLLLCSLSYAKDAKEIQFGVYKEQDPKQFMKDPDYQRVLKEVQQQFAVKAFQSNDISSNELTLKNVIGVQTAVVSGLNIQFEVELVGSDGKTIDVSLVAWYQPWKNSVILVEYSIYRIY